MFDRRFLSEFLLLAGFGCTLGRADEPVVVRTSLCELARNPEAFNGKMVRVRASAMGWKLREMWIDDFTQSPPCTAWMGVVVALPEYLKPKPDFEAVRDASFQQFLDGLRSGMNVEACFDGRFEAVYTWKEQRRVWLRSNPRQKGFGKKGRYGGRIVLYRISDVVARHVPRL